jgi:hypothetical protein
MKMKAGFSLEQITIQRIEALAAGTRRDKSTIVDMAIELLSSQDEFSDLIPPARPRAARSSKRTKVDPSKVAGVHKGLALPEAV